MQNFRLVFSNVWNKFGYMEAVSRINLTDDVLLHRIAIVQRQLGDSTATKTASRLLEMKLTELGIGLPSHPREARTETQTQPTT